MKTRFLLMVGVSVLMAGVVHAQETPEPNPSGYDLSGNLSVGYRLINVGSPTAGDWFQNNSENLFHEQFGLSTTGPAIGNRIPMSLNLFGSRPGGSDQIFLNAEFNPTVQGGSLRLRGIGSYDLKVSYKNVNYFLNRFDSLFSDLRRYNSNRQDLAADLAVTATENIGFNFGYHNIAHGGTVQLPRPLYLEAGTEGPDRIFFNVFRNYFLQELPRTDRNSEFTAAINGNFDMLSFNAGAGYMNFKENFELTPVQTRDALPLNYRDSKDTVGRFANEFGIVGDNALAERLLYFYHNEERQLAGPFFFAQASLTPADLLTFTADFRMENLTGKTDVSIGENAEIRRSAGSGTSIRRYNLAMRGTYAGEIEDTLKRLEFSAAATLTPMPELDVTAGVKITNTTSGGKAEYNARLDTAGLSATQNFKSAIDSLAGVAKFDFLSRMNEPITTIFGIINFAPMKDLDISAGVNIATRSPLAYREEDGAYDSVLTNNLSKKVSSLGFNVGLGYRIMPELRVRGRFEMLQREAKFSDQTLTPGPASGTVTDLEPRNAPENVTRIGAGLDWTVLEGLNAGLRFNLQNAKSDLTESAFIKPNSTGNKVEMTNDDMGISLALNYALDENTNIALSGETRNRKYSIPVTWTRGAALPAAGQLFDSVDNIPRNNTAVGLASVILAEETNDIFVDLGVNTRLADALTAGIGFSYLGVTGYPTITPQVAGNPSTPASDSTAWKGTPTGQGDVTRTGGPFNRLTVNGNLGYDISSRLGVVLDVFYAMQKEEEKNFDGASGKLTVPAYTPVESISYGYNSYNGLSAAISVNYNF